MQKKMLMFDWNNTMFDDFWVWNRAIKKAFGVFGKKSPAPGEFFERYKGSMTETFFSFGIDTTSEYIREIFYGVYESHKDKLGLSNGAHNALFGLMKRGFILALVTACSRDIAVVDIDRFGLLNAFSYLEFGATEKAGVIRRLFLRERVIARRCFYVGDSPSDMMHARKAGVHAVAFLNGNIPEDLVLKERPGFCIRNFDELLHMADAWLNLEDFRTQDM